MARQERECGKKEKRQDHQGESLVAPSSGAGSVGGQPQERQLLSSAWAQSDASARQKTRLGGGGPFLAGCYLPHAQGKQRLRGLGCKILGSNPLPASDTFSYEALRGTRSEGTHDTHGGIGIFRAENQASLDRCTVDPHRKLQITDDRSYRPRASLALRRLCRQRRKQCLAQLQRLPKMFLIFRELPVQFQRLFRIEVGAQHHVAQKHWVRQAGLFIEFFQGSGRIKSVHTELPHAVSYSLISVPLC